MFLINKRWSNSLAKVYLFLLLIFFSPFVKSESTADVISNYEVRISPLGLIVKWYSLELAYHINEKIDFGIHGTFYGINITDKSTGSSLGLPVNDGYSVGINSNYYFDKLANKKSQFYLGFKMSYDDFKDVRHLKMPIYENKGVSVKSLLGIRHPFSFLSCSFVLLTGAGFIYNFYDSKEKPSFYVANPAQETSPRLEFYPEFKMAFLF